MNLKKIYAWCVHLLTASGSVFSVLAIIKSAQAYTAKINCHHIDFILYLKFSFIYTIISVLIDAVDGTLARQVNIKKLAPFDGGLLDNIIDFISYAIIPSVWIFVIDIMPNILTIISLNMILLASCYQFCQVDAKTKDHFFKGFPSYWNVVIYYLIYFGFSGINNFIIVIVLFILTFIPIKYIYPSRMRYVSGKKIFLISLFTCTLIWGVATIVSVIMWPKLNPILALLIISYILLYFGLSIYRTIKPLHD